MKKAVFLLALIAGGSVYGQKVQDSLTMSRFNIPSNELTPMEFDFSYYSKNYEEVFGRFNFTNDANNFGARNVYVGYGDRHYYQGNSTFIMEMPNAIHNLNFCEGQDVVAMIKNLSAVFSAEKDYSVKQE